MERKKKRVLVVDDHPLFREGIKALIAPLDDFEVVGEAGECGPAVDLALALDPHLILMDLSLPDGSGIDALREIRARRPGVEVAVVTMHAKVEVLKKAFAAGASGYMVKESAAERLTDCLRAVCEGHSYIDPSLTGEFLESLDGQGPAGGAAAEEDPYEKLTPREQQVLRLIAEGVRTREIAERLGISARTVENHKAHIMSKLDLHSTGEVVHYAARIGLIRADREPD